MSFRVPKGLPPDLLNSCEDLLFLLNLFYLLLAPPS